MTPRTLKKTCRQTFQGVGGIDRHCEWFTSGMTRWFGRPRMGDFPAQWSSVEPGKRNRRLTKHTCTRGGLPPIINQDTQVYHELEHFEIEEDALTLRCCCRTESDVTSRMPPKPRRVPAAPLSHRRHDFADHPQALFQRRFFGAVFGRPFCGQRRCLWLGWWNHH